MASPQKKKSAEEGADLTYVPAEQSNGGGYKKPASGFISSRLSTEIYIAVPLTNYYFFVGFGVSSPRPGP